MFVSRFLSRESEFKCNDESEECSRQVLKISNIADDKFKRTEPSRYFAAYFFPFYSVEIIDVRGK